MPLSCRYSEPPIGIEPMIYALREARAHAAQALPAQIARRMALTAPFAVAFPGHPFHEPFHAKAFTCHFASRSPLSAPGRCSPDGAALDFPSPIRLAAWLSTARGEASPRLGVGVLQRPVLHNPTRSSHSRKADYESSPHRSTDIAF